MTKKFSIPDDYQEIDWIVFDSKFICRRDYKYEIGGYDFDPDSEFDRICGFRVNGQDIAELIQIFGLEPNDFKAYNNEWRSPIELELKIRNSVGYCSETLPDKLFAKLDGSNVLFIIKWDNALVERYTLINQKVEIKWRNQE